VAHLRCSQDSRAMKCGYGYFSFFLAFFCQMHGSIFDYLSIQYELGKQIRKCLKIRCFAIDIRVCPLLYIRSNLLFSLAYPVRYSAENLARKWRGVSEKSVLRDEGRYIHSKLKNTGVSRKCCFHPVFLPSFLFANENGFSGHSRDGAYIRTLPWFIQSIIQETGSHEIITLLPDSSGLYFHGFFSFFF